MCLFIHAAAEKCPVLFLRRRCCLVYRYTARDLEIITNELELNDDEDRVSYREFVQIAQLPVGSWLSRLTDRSFVD